MGTIREIEGYINSVHSEPVRDPVWSHIYLDPALLRVVDTPPVQQLNRIRQLGPTYLVYPGATHTRLNHSLGVFHVAKRMILRLLRSPEPPDLSLNGVKSFLAAALLHDVGHFPYTHSFKRLPLAPHERLTAQIVQEEPLATRLREYGVDPGHVAAIVDDEIDGGGIDEINLYRNILSGSLDPDKLDYLNRDAYFCGVPYGIQDTDYALSRIVADGYRGLAIPHAGLSAMENVLFSKFLMYRAVYWHRTVRTATAMIKKAVFLGLREGVIEPGDLYGMDDESFVREIGSRRFPPFALIRMVPERNLLKPVADIAFEPDEHGALERIDARERVEAAVAADLDARSSRSVMGHEVILDLPDPISFEIDTPVIENGVARSFRDVSVFSPDVVAGFSRSLRRIRLMVAPDLAPLLGDALAYLSAAINDAL